MNSARKTMVICLLAALSLSAVAASPNELIQQYARQAASEQTGFTPSARRGANFYRQPFAVSAEMPACVSCHTEQPGQPGRHVITGKRILPLAPVANGERFSDPAKRIKAVSLDQTNQAMRQVFKQPGYWRIEKPLLSYDALSWIGAGVLGLIAIVLIGVRVYRKRIA